MKLNLLLALITSHAAFASISPVKFSRSTDSQRNAARLGKYRVAAFHELKPHEANIFTGITYFAGNSLRGVVKLGENLCTSVSLRNKRRAGEDLAYSNLQMLQQSTKDLKTLLVTSFLLTRPLVSSFTYFAIIDWPMAVLPSTFEAPWERRLRFEKRCRRTAEAPIALLSQLDDGTRIKKKSTREQYGKYTEVAQEALRTKSYKELLSLLDPYLAVPDDKKKAKKNVGALPWQFVKCAQLATGDSPKWLPAWTTRGALVDHLKNIQKHDETLRHYLPTLSRDEMDKVALDRGMLSNDKVTDAKLRAHISEYLDIAQVDDSRDPLRTRLALIAYNSMDAARSMPIAKLYQ
uniref:Letm1 RBD domain-containing protein n=1 Tax=Octactis speculum TaxID=3111310 RepID=A0A7S2GL49_9STRA